MGVVDVTESSRPNVTPPSALPTVGPVDVLIWAWTVAAVALPS
jgi:hypothetical protein